MRKCLVLFAVCIYSLVSDAQNVGIGTPNPQNKLHVGGGFRLDTLTGVGGAGLLWHNANGVVYGLKYSGNVNEVLRGDGTFGPYNPAINGALGWLLTGNSGTNPATHFLGTTDDQPLIFRVNNIRYGLLGGSNIFFGANAGIQSTAGSNVGIGDGALKSNIFGSGSIAIGDSALAYTTFGNNTAIGYRALMKVTSTENVAVGYESLANSTTGSSNTAIGYQAMKFNTGGFWNTAVGAFALRPGNGEQNTAIGFGSMSNNTSGLSNSALGSRALYNNTSGYFNTAIGAEAAFVNNGGHDITAIGYRALYLNNQGHFNTSVGAFSMYNNTQGYQNTAIGYKALEQNRFGIQNTATGFGALQQNIDGNGNSAFGLEALRDNSGTNATGNVAFGYRALVLNVTGQVNTAVGALAGSNLPNNVSNVTCIGYGTGWNTTLSNQVNIGNFSVTWIGGQTGWFHYSDKRIKNDIKDDVPGLSFITRLKPITYHVDVRKQEEIENAGKNTTSELIKPTQKDWEGKYDVEKIKMTGFFAQDVEEAAKSINYSFNGVHNPKNGGLLSIDYSAFVVPLVKAVQEQQKIIDDQNKKIEKQQQQIDLLIKEMQSLKKDLITQKN